MRAVAILWMSCSLAVAQQLVTVRGTVTGPSGAPVVGAPVQAANEQTGAIYRAVSGAKGEYSLNRVSAGRYQFSSQVPGFAFQPFSKAGVIIPGGSTFRYDIQLTESGGLGTIGDDPYTYNANLREQAARMTGRPPRTSRGVPDLNGVWNAKNDLFPEEPEVLPWAKQEFQRRVENHFKDGPSAYCLPGNVLPTDPFLHRFVQTRDFIAILREDDTGSFRQIYMDGRPHPKELNPTWFGHSIGRWQGDTLVVDVVGFNARSWLGPYPHTEKLHLIETYRRVDVGHLEVKITVEDPGTLSKPWHINMVWDLAPKEDIIETVCTENNADVPRYVGK